MDGSNVMMVGISLAVILVIIIVILVIILGLGGGEGGGGGGGLPVEVRIPEAVPRTIARERIKRGGGGVRPGARTINKEKGPEEESKKEMIPNGVVAPISLGVSEGLGGKQEKMEISSGKGIEVGAPKTSVHIPQGFPMGNGREIREEYTGMFRSPGPDGGFFPGSNYHPEARGDTRENYPHEVQKNLPLESVPYGNSFEPSHRRNLDPSQMFYDPSRGVTKDRGSQGRNIFSHGFEPPRVFSSPEEIQQAHQRAPWMNYPSNGEERGDFVRNLGKGFPSGPSQGLFGGNLSQKTFERNIPPDLSTGPVTLGPMGLPKGDPSKNPAALRDWRSQPDNLVNFLSQKGPVYLGPDGGEVKEAKREGIKDFGGHPSQIDFPKGNSLAPFEEISENKREVFPRHAPSFAPRQTVPLNIPSRSTNTQTYRRSRDTGRTGEVDIRSQTTIPSERSEMTPREPLCLEKSDGPGLVCHRELNPENLGGASVVDLCSYSNGTLILLSDGVILKEVGNPAIRSRIRSNVKLERLESFGGYLYGIGKGTLYRLDNSTYQTRKWKWSPQEWAPAGIVHSSAVLTGSHLWLQDRGYGYLYNNNLGLQEKIVLNNSNLRRIYGADAKTYLEIDPLGCHARKMPEDLPLNDVCAGALTYAGEIIPIKRESMSKYSNVRLLNWVPHYIRG